MHYYPKVICGKCNKSVDKLMAVHQHRQNRRFLRAYCHGETIDVNFVTERDKVITIWAKKDSAHEILEKFMSTAQQLQDQMDAIAAEASRNTSVAQSALAVIIGLASKIQDLQTTIAGLQTQGAGLITQTQLDNLASEATGILNAVRNNDDQLAAAVASNPQSSPAPATPTPASAPAPAPTQEPAPASAPAPSDAALPSGSLPPVTPPTG